MVCETYPVNSTSVGSLSIVVYLYLCVIDGCLESLYLLILCNFCVFFINFVGDAHD